MKNIRGKIFVVTGGASGLGEAAARRIAASGGRVLLLDVNETVANKLVQELNQQSGDTRALFVKCNIISEEQVKKALDQAKQTFGTVFAGLINCAGIGGAKTVVSTKGPYPLEEFRRVIDVNVIGNFNVLRLVAQEISQQPKPSSDEDGERGVLIQTASVAAFEGQIGQVAYSASKGAIVSMTLPMARELGRHGIRVVTIAPGLFDTPMLQLLPDKVRKSLEKQVPFPQRFGKPSEFADLVYHIIENTMINGETLRLDGSIRMSAM